MNIPELLIPRLSTWEFASLLPEALKFYRRGKSSTEELHFYGTATAYTTQELDLYGIILQTVSREQLYFSKERRQNSKERCLLLKIAVTFYRNTLHFK